MKRRQQKYIALTFSLLLAGGLSFVQWVHAGHALFEDRLIVWFFDIGQGDAIFIESPSGEQVLIDGGPDGRVLDKLGSVMPLWDRTIDRIILTHPHADHLDGLVEVAQEYDVETVYLTNIDFYTPSLPEFERRISDGESIVEVTEPFSLDLGSGARLDILYPTSSFAGERVKDPNETSIVALLTYGETSVLLTGDATATNESELMKLIDAPVDVLKVGHHGSAYSSSLPFLQDLMPRFAVISCGVDNDYGHPAPITLERLRTVGSTIFRTDLHGDIRLVSDGGEPVLKNFLP